MINLVTEFKNYLVKTEKSHNTAEKYMRDIYTFFNWLGDNEISKELVSQYKEHILRKYKISSVNSMLSSINSFFDFCGRYDLKTKTLKIQRKIFENENKNLTKAEYEKLLAVAKQKGDNRLYYLMQTICATGIRVSELEFITINSVKSGVALIDCKGKVRTVILPKSLCKMLASYIKANKIKNGSIFITKNGTPLDRSNIWKLMKNLCQLAGVCPDKVFPHNLRHLFAKTYYAVKKDIVRLADILGHSNINTTRIYTMESFDVHRRQIEKLGLLMC